MKKKKRRKNDGCLRRLYSCPSVCPFFVCLSLFPNENEVSIFIFFFAAILKSPELMTWPSLFSVSSGILVSLEVFRCCPALSQVRWFSGSQWPGLHRHYRTVSAYIQKKKVKKNKKTVVYILLCVVAWEKPVELPKSFRNLESCNTTHKQTKQRGSVFFVCFTC